MLALTYFTEVAKETSDGNYLETCLALGHVQVMDFLRIMGRLQKIALRPFLYSF